MIQTSLVSSIVILLWRMIWFIPAPRVLSPPAVPKYNMQSAYTLSLLKRGWEASGLRRCLPSSDPCSTSVTFSNNPQRSLVSSSNFCPPWLRTQQGLSWMSSRLWAVQGKPTLINRRDPLWSKGPSIPQEWKPFTCSWNAIPQKFKASLCAPLAYLFLAMSHGVTPLRWQKEMTQKLESKVTVSSHSWSHSRQGWHTNSCF